MRYLSKYLLHASVLIEEMAPFERALLLPKKCRDVPTPTLKLLLATWPSSSP